MEHNVNIADLFTSLEKFKAVVTRLRMTMDGDPVDRKRLKNVMSMVKEDIEELFGQIGRE